MMLRGCCAFTLLALIAIGGGAAGAQIDTGLTCLQVDHLIRAEWKAHGIKPSRPATEAEYMRRAYLDIVGTIPSAEAVTAFLADHSPGKRAALVDSLLGSPEYATHWRDYWDNVLMGLRPGSQLVDQYTFRQWLEQEFAQNTPWNQFVCQLISATGQNSTGGSYAKAMGLMRPNEMDDGGSAPGDAGQVNGAVNWSLKYVGNPQDLAGQVSKLFLGVQIQCAQCHDGKNVAWKQSDFQRFAACFIETRPVPIDRGKVRGIRRVDLVDGARPFLGGGKLAAANQPYAIAVPAALDGTSFADSPDRRLALAQWLTSPRNPWFAEAIVNRMWNHFLGRGFVEPVDDFRETNPAIMPGLLKKLADDFVRHGYDLKYLIRTICATQVYQLSSDKAENEGAGDTLWARYRLQPMGPDELIDSLVTATNVEPLLERIAGNRLAQLKFVIQRQFTFLFNVDEEFEQKDFQGTIPQALLLLNGAIVNRSVTPLPGTAEAEVMAMAGGDEARITSLYLRTLSRQPTVAELRHWVAFVNNRTEAVMDPAPAPAPPKSAFRFGPRTAKPGGPGNGPDPLARAARRPVAIAEATPKVQAYEDLFWALLNSSEFAFNH